LTNTHPISLGRKIMLNSKKSLCFRNLSGRLLQSSALIGLVAISGTGAWAQEASSNVESVTVTGTAIRGATAPVGSNVITLDRDAIEATNATSVQQLLTNLPSVTQFGNSGQGSFASDPAGASAPSIHSIGASASNSTLVLIDGHRIPLAGISHAQADPSTIPTIAIQRVEVLPDGASSIYGSDAVAGVINFITRKNFQGAQTDVEYGSGFEYSSFNFGQILGTAWEHGSFMAAYSYTSNGQLSGANRSFVNDNQSYRGLSNLGNFNCSPASIAATSSTSIFSYPYNGVAVPNVSTTSANCGQTRNAAIIPSENRNAALVSMRQELNDWLTISGDVNWSNRVDSQAVSRGVLTATAFGPGSGKGNQINPFYIPVPGSATGTETVRYDFNQLLGPGANTKFGTEVVMGTVNLDIKLGGDWIASIDGLAGATQNFARTVGVICTPCANLALNGTTNASGSLTTSSTPVILATTNLTTRPLSVSNALNVWDGLGSAAAGGNNTSGPVLTQLVDNNNFSQTRQNMNDLNIKAGGTIFNDGAGDVKTSFGVEYRNYGISQYAVSNGASGPSTTNSTFYGYSFGRSLYAVYGELLIPAISEEANIPLVRKLDFDVSGRYDRYSDFGGTKNPKVGVTWEIVDGLKARASYSTSFVAPALTSIGNSSGLSTESSVTYSTGGGGPATVPANYPNNGGGNSTLPAGFCSAGCTIGTSTNQGVVVSGPGGKSARAETALTYSAGFDLDAGKLWKPLNGFTVSATYWQAKFIGAITNPIMTLDVSLPALNKNVIIAPSDAQIAVAYNSGLRVAGVPSGPITFLQYATQQNAYNLYTNGVDLSINYAFSLDNLGDFMVGLDSTTKLRVDQQGGGYGAPITNNLNINANNTFSSLANVWRSSFGWHLDPFGAQIFVNYENGYSEPTATPPFTGFLRIPAYVTVDANLSYDLPGTWRYLSGTEVYISAKNLLNIPPPPYNVAAGYDPMDANPLGRLLLVGMRKKW
jgi:iron complex outermembrane receptor protein